MSPFWPPRPLAAQQAVPERTAEADVGGHAEVLAFLDSLANHGAAISVGTLGGSPQGRRIPYVVAARPMVADPAEAKRSGKPVLHPGATSTRVKSREGSGAAVAA
ncbi:MAG: hypothetical protein IPG05_15690 [Gemmatimonadetes bacterium]|nr:hypothetical protein [Gemmatimonadota bacterium]